MVDIFEYLWSILIKYKLIYVFVSIGYWYNSFVMILVVMKKWKFLYLMNIWYVVLFIIRDYIIVKFKSCSRYICVISLFKKGIMIIY